MEGKDILYLPCCHGFHSKCIGEWLKTNDTCPECRLSLANGLIFDGSILATTELEFNADRGTFSSTGSQKFHEIIKKEGGIIEVGEVNIFKKEFVKSQQYEKYEVSLIPSESNQNLSNATLMLTRPGQNNPDAIAKAINPWDDGEALYKGIKDLAFNQYTEREGLNVHFLYKNEKQLIDAFIAVLDQVHNRNESENELPFLHLSRLFATYLNLCEIRPTVLKLILPGRRGGRLSNLTVENILKDSNIYPKYIKNLTRKFQCAVENKMFLTKEMNDNIEKAWKILTKHSDMFLSSHAKEREARLGRSVSQEARIQEQEESETDLKVGDLVKKIKGKGKGETGRVVFAVSKLNRVKVRVVNSETSRIWNLQSQANYSSQGCEL
jgi:hypothetical protein